ncbi:MAG: GNAT family N-acetyltransferase [Actinobacteria bacterium]|nr:GNAT family N-acetyltransferase [Actinomycetota bacterium]
MPREILTDRLRLRCPGPGDLDAMFAITSDPRVWTHFPSLRPTEPGEVAAMLERWSSSWRTDGLGPWIVLLRETGEIIGNGGCTMLRAEAAHVVAQSGAAGAGPGGDPGADDASTRIWNLGYRLSVEQHGRGYATEVSRAALAAAAEVAPDVPVIAYLVEHNRASAAVAEKVGLQRVHRAPDAGNPDPAVMRLVYADRILTSAQLATALR